MLNGSQQKPKPRRRYSLVPARKGQDEINDVQIEIEKREGREEKNYDKSTSATQERRQHAKTQFPLTQVGKSARPTRYLVLGFHNVRIIECWVHFVFLGRGPLGRRQ